MAVYTEIDSDTLAEFAAQYPLSQIDEFKGITAGVQNSNFLLTTMDAKYILTIYERSANGVAAAGHPVARFGQPLEDPELVGNFM